MAITLESGIPVPPVRRGLALPFEELDVDESFSAPIPEGQKPGTFAAKVRSRAMLYAKRHGGKFVVRLVTDEDTGANKVRCWRVK